MIPQVILLDEPAAGVNPSLARILVERIEALNQRGMTFVIIEHDMDFVMRHCDPVIALAEGRIVFQGTVAEAQADPLLLEAYLGTRRVTSALKIEALEAGYVRDLPILRQVDLAVERASLTVIIGPNGAGKSTLIKAVAGLVPVSGGRVLLDGQDITGIRPDQMGALGLSYVPQTDNIFRHLSIRENLALVLRRASDRQARLAELFALFPALAPKQADRAGSLSGGQRQMLAIAMALAPRPRVVLMDEPSAGLSPKIAAEVLDLVRSLTHGGVTVLLVEQNVRRALKVADHCYILAEGRNQMDGPAAAMLADPVVGEIYLGGRRVGAA